MKAQPHLARREDLGLDQARLVGWLQIQVIAGRRAAAERELEEPDLVDSRMASASMRAQSG